MAKKIIKGEVVSEKGSKTITVIQSFSQRDKRFLKIVKKSKRIMAHDEEGKAHLGDIVTIQECRPISKRKNFVLLEIIEKKAEITG